MFYEYCLWAQAAVLLMLWIIFDICYSYNAGAQEVILFNIVVLRPRVVIVYIGIGDIYRCCIWVELPVQRRLCPIFVRDVGSPDIHEYSAG